VKLLRITEVRYSAGALPYDREVRAELVRGDGREFVLPVVARAFAETIEHEVYSLLLPKARSASPPAASSSSEIWRSRPMESRKVVM